MDLLRNGQTAVFKTYDGKLITGKVIAVMPNCYLVVAETGVCTMYTDGLWRFTDSNVVRHP